MSERPILFSAPMVRAILAGTKTVTRRIVAPMPGRQAEWLTRAGIDASPRLTIASAEGRLGAAMEHPRGGPGGWIACPYGAHGDRLWVREAWCTPRSFDALNATQMAEQCAAAGYTKPWVPIQYAADGARRDWNPRHPDTDDPPGRLRAARFLPRWASRILLGVVDVRVERLHEITEDDARAEGVGILPAGTDEDGAHFDASDHRTAFRSLWDAINGARAPWASNPWVWRVEFRRCGDVS